MRIFKLTVSETINENDFYDLYSLKESIKTQLHLRNMQTVSDNDMIKYKLILQNYIRDFRHLSIFKRGEIKIITKNAQIEIISSTDLNSLIGNSMILGVITSILFYIGNHDDIAKHIWLRNYAA